MDVLIIEDDPMVEFIHRNYLEKLNYFQNIYSTASQTQAIAYLNDIKIQLVLLDIHIKEGNGLELLKLLRNQHQNTEVIVISAANEAHTVKEAFHLGIVDYLIKPFTFERFESSIEKFLNHYHTFEADKIYQDNIDHFQKIDSGWLEGEVKLDEKGLSEITYQHILDAIQELEQPFTIQELAKCSQFSHVSVRKYIAYMEEKGLLTSQQIYTKVGRPYKVYKLIKKNLGL